MRIQCIFDINKKCDDCGECERCDLSPDKVCTSCGKCLQSESNEVRSIQIDDIFEGEVEEGEEEALLKPEESDSTDAEEESEGLEYIDDIAGLKEILEDKEALQESLEETFPGFYRLKKQ